MVDTLPDDQFAPTIVGGIDSSGIPGALAIPCSRGCGRKAWLSPWGQKRIEAFPETKVICMYCNTTDAAMGNVAKLRMPSPDTLSPEEKRGVAMLEAIQKIRPGAVAKTATVDTFLAILAGAMTRHLGPGIVPYLPKLGEIREECNSRGLLGSEHNDALRTFKWAVDQYLDTTMPPVADTLKQVDTWITKRKLPKY